MGRNKERSVIMSLNGLPVEGVLCDITGVLAESSSDGDGVVVPGSIDAIKRLGDAGIKVKFVTNESARTRASLHAKLTRLGYIINMEDILTPALAMVVLLKEQQLRPHLLVNTNVMEDFSGIETEDPNCVVLGDAMDEFSYTNLNTAFQVLLKSNSMPLFSLGKGKFYREDTGLNLDVGPFTAALEFASERKAVICGKPDKTFFKAGLTALGLEAEKVVWLGMTLSLMLEVPSPLGSGVSKSGRGNLDLLMRIISWSNQILLLTILRVLLMPF